MKKSEVIAIFETAINNGNLLTDEIATTVKYIATSVVYSSLKGVSKEVYEDCIQDSLMGFYTSLKNGRESEWKNSSEQMYAYVRKITTNVVVDQLSKIKKTDNLIIYGDKNIVNKNSDTITTLFDLMASDENVEETLIERIESIYLNKNMMKFVFSALKKKAYYKLFTALKVTRKKTFGYEIIKNGNGKYNFKTTNKAIFTESGNVELSANEKGKILIRGGDFCKILLPLLINYLDDLQMKAAYNSIKNDLIHIETLFIQSDTWLRKVRRNKDNITQDNLYDVLS